MRGTNGGERRRVAPASTRAPNPTGPLGTFGLAVMAVMAVLLLGTVVSAPAQAAEPTPAATAEATPSEPGPDPGIVRSYGDDTRIPPPLRGPVAKASISTGRTAGAGTYDVVVVAVNTAEGTSDATAENSPATLARADGHWNYATGGAYRLDYRTVVTLAFAGADPCDLSALDSAANPGVVDATGGLTPRAGHRGVLVVYSLPPADEDTCGSGLGWVGGISAYIGGHWTEPVGADSVAHEVGHNFGLDHANSLECAGAGSFRDGTQVHKPTWPCTTQEYGDYSAIMGMDVDDVSSGIPAHRRLSFTQLQALGLVSDAARTEVGIATGQFSLNPIDGAAAGVQALHLSVPGTATSPDLQSVTLEYRSLDDGILRPGIYVTADLPDETYPWGPAKHSSWTYVGKRSFDFDFDYGLKTGMRLQLADGRQVVVNSLGATANVTIVAKDAPIPPGAPQQLVATAGDRTATLTFQAPADTGGAALTKYQYALDGGTWTDCLPVSSTPSCAITGLTNGTTYSIAVRAYTTVPGAASDPVNATPTAPVTGAVFVPLRTPIRAVDTGQIPGGALPSGAAAGRVFSVVRAQGADPGSAPVVPADAVAIAYNITAAKPQAAGHLRVMPGDVPSSAASALNFRARESIANASVVAVPSPASVRVENWSTQGTSTNVIIDVTGYFVPVTSPAGAAALNSGLFTPLATPTRVFDNDRAELAPKATAQISVATGQDGSDVVPTGASAVAYTITVTGPTSGGHLRVMPGDQDSTQTSAINWPAAGERIANSAIVALDANRTLRVYNAATTPVHFLVDVSGYFSSDGSGFHPIAPARVYNSTQLVPPAPIAAGEDRTISTATVLGSPDTTAVPSGASAIAFNLTVTNSGPLGHFRIHPGGTGKPSASVLNWPAAGYKRANAGFVGIDAARDVKVYSSGGSNHAILDILGWFG